MGPPATAPVEPTARRIAVRVPGYAVLAGRPASHPSTMDECTVDGEVATAQPGDFHGGRVTADIVGPIKGGPGIRRL